MMIVITFAVGLALAMIAWVGIDTARRKRNWLAWSAATAFFGFFGLLAWLIRRRWAQVPPEPIEFRQALLIAITAPILFAVSVIADRLSEGVMVRVIAVYGCVVVAVSALATLGPVRRALQIQRIDALRAA